jgi:phosphoribosyl 1,2-cyclic phosphodiesterase
MEFLAYASSSAGNLYSARAGDSALLLDCGIRMAEIRRALGFRVSGLAGCLLSHHHGDHSRAAADLMRAGVNVYASAGTWAGLGLHGHRALVVAPGKHFRVRGYLVTPFDLRHDAEGTLGFVVQAPDGDRLLFICDTSHVVYTFGAGLTHIAIEANYSERLLRHSDSPPEHRARVLRNHMSLERALGVLAANDLSRLREVHLLHLSDRHADAAEFKAAVQRATGKPAYVAPRRLGEDSL